MISRIPYLGGYNEADVGYELPIDRDAVAMKAPEPPRTQMERDKIEEGRKLAASMVLSGKVNVEYEHYTGAVELKVEPEWPAYGEHFYWVRDANAESLIRLYALCEKRLRELGACGKGL